MATKRQAAAVAVENVDTMAQAYAAREIMIPLELIDESPNQPRQTFDAAALEELADNFREHGQLQPALVRPKGDRYELVFGARRLRAARLADFPVLRCNVREDLDERGALELQIVENAQREGIHPAEEADAYRRLRDEHDLTVDQVAAKVGKSRAWVYARLKLCDLAPGPRAEFLAGKLDASRALLIARMPAAFQAEACRDLIDESDESAAPGCERDPMSFRAAQRHLRERYMLKLKDARFDVTDTALVPSSPACGACLRRTGNALELFGDVNDADVCTDPGCFNSKREAAWQKQCAAATAKGKATALPVAACNELFERWSPDRLAYSAPYVDLSSAEWVGQQSKPWREILGKKLPPVVLVQDREGHTHECVDRQTAEAALERARAEVEGAKPSKGGAGVVGAYHQPPARDKVLDDAMTGRFIEAVVERAAKGKPGDEFYRWLILREMGMGDPPVSRVAARRGLLLDADTTKGYNPDAFDVIKAAANKLRGPALLGLLVEMMATPDDYSYRPDNTWVIESCDLWGVDRKALGGEVRKELKAAAKVAEKAEKVAAKSAPPAPAKGKSKAVAHGSRYGTCSRCGCTDAAACPGGCGAG
jgi:ParB/RepB/Spo0J family partition protein